MKKHLLSLLIILNFSIIYSHSGGYKHSIIIDTDAAADDLRAICMLLSSNQINTIAITSSDGALLPDEGLKKIRALLKSFGHEGIPVAAGIPTQSQPPKWRKLSQTIIWGNESDEKFSTDYKASELIIYSLKNEEEPVTIVCLGSLTNIAESLKKNPTLKEKIESIVWYNNSIHPSEGTNYEIDKKAADYILSSNIKLDMVTSTKNNEINFSKELLQSIKNIPNPYAQKIAETHYQNPAYKMIKTNHFKLWDDLVALYMFYPELFEHIVFENYPQHSQNKFKLGENADEKIIETLINNEDTLGVVFNQFPVNPDFYRDDVKESLDQILLNHGIEEWKLAVLTNEFHNHLGIYSIIGAKMGLRAMEYFHIGRDEMSVVSYAGNRPPISCLNDGLQMSTGATLGQGTIKAIIYDLQQRPKALFNYKNYTIVIELKPEYWQIVRDDIKKGIEMHGNLTDNYWLFVRELAIKYWSEWSRKEIFIIEKIDI